MPRKKRKPKFIAERARALLEKPGATVEAVAEKLGVPPYFVVRASQRHGNRGRPRARGVPIRIRLPVEIVEAADARVTAETDRSAVLIAALRSALITDP